ncbi:uncharacterized protein LOC134446805 [Engraulis encrasicolus]|uniref:uncharacterized protein LOC134446805 n=1 Tax=Engraulis encrasicolus TaxID=184585 RepID=UPI002FD0EE04
MSHSSDKDPRELAGQVQRVQTALQVYGVLMRTHGEVLQKHVGELLRASNDVSKSCEVRRAAGVTGGSTKAVGSAAAVAGIVLAPVTMGLSLAITAVGVGVLAAGGIAKSKIKGQAVLSHDRRALETNVQDCRKKMADIEACLRFIHTGMDHIMQQRNLSKVLKGADIDPARVSKMLDLSGAVARGAAAAGGSSDLLRGFAGGLGKYYSKKNSQVLRKSKVDKFGKSLYKVSQRLQSTLNDLRKTADSLSRF